VTEQKATPQWLQAFGKLRMCVDRLPPPGQRTHFAKLAVQENPHNRPRLQSPRLGVTPLEMALVTAKKWPAGRKITVGFLERNPQREQLIRQTAPQWSQFCSLTFEFVNSPQQADCRITFSAPGAWSYIGTDILGIPKNQATMNFNFIDEGTVLHEFGHCLDGDTLIDCPRDLEKYPRGIPIRELVGQTPWVYAWQDGRVVVRKASRVWLSKRMVPTVRVRLCTDYATQQHARFLPPLELVGTPDHPVLLADGVTWKPLGDLQPGDRLCSIYRSSHRNRNCHRTRLTWTGLSGRVMEHILVCEEVNGPRVGSEYVAHHVNGNPLNQGVDNLEWLTRADHNREHHAGKAVSDEARERMSASAVRRGISEETQAKMLSARLDHYRKHPQSSATRGKRSESLRAFHDKKRAANHVVLSVEKSENRDVYDMTVPGAANFFANGVCVHNCIGCIHEHQHPQEGIPWNRQKVYQYYAGPPNYWSQQMVDENIFQKYSATITQFSNYDTSSIMHYPVDPALTDGNFKVGWNRQLSDTDKNFIGQMYPKDGGQGGGDGTGTPTQPAGQVAVPASGSYRFVTVNGQKAIVFG
jgi:hypothetical protein